MEDELIIDYCTTDNDEYAEEILLLIIMYFLEAYEDEKIRFARVNNVDITTLNDDAMIDEYVNYLIDLLADMRERCYDKMSVLESLHNEPLPKAEVAPIGHGFLSKEDYTDLLAFIIVNWDRLEDTEYVSAKQTAQFKVVEIVQEKNSGARIYKQWVAHQDCRTCPVCMSLHGTIIPLEEPFLVNGQVVELDNGKFWTYDYNDRFIAVAHPWDRCWIEFIIEL